MSGAGNRCFMETTENKTLNGLEWRATSYAIRIFPHLDPGIWSVHVQMDNMVAFFHSVKKEDIQKQMRPD